MTSKCESVKYNFPAILQNTSSRFLFTCCVNVVTVSLREKKKKELEFFSRDGFEIFTEKSDFWICVLMESY